LYSKYPYKYTPSINHKIPLTNDGKHELENMVLCCYKCNIIKSTMTDKTYKELLNRINYDLGFLNTIFNELDKGRKASLISRHNSVK